MKRIGILTGGGDAPGLNAVIRAVVYAATEKGYEVCGFLRGWKGILELEYRILHQEDVEDIHRLGGTILGSSRTNVRKVEGGFDKVKQNMSDLDIYALIAAGGEDTLGVALDLFKSGGRVVGCPKTIDNDVNATDYTFGFDTAINRVMECMDWLHTTAESHHRVMVVEVMGRHAGWMTLDGGLAGGAHIILIPEVPFNLDEVCDIVRRRHARGKKYTMIAVAEGAEDPKYMEDLKKSASRDDFGHIQLGGIGKMLRKEIEKRTGYETREAVLGHLQRGGAPSAFDRVLGTRLGLGVVQLIQEEKWGQMIALQGMHAVGVSLEQGVGSLKTVPQSRYDELKLFFG